MKVNIYRTYTNIEIKVSIIAGDNFKHTVRGQKY